MKQHIIRLTIILIILMTNDIIITGSNKAHHNKSLKLLQTIGINNTSKTRQLLKAGTKNPNIQNNRVWVPLHLAVYYNNRYILQLLLKYNADIDIKNNDGNTSMYKTVTDDNIDMAKLLLKKQR